MKTNRTQFSYAYGEVSPEMTGRLDSPVNYQAVEKMINFTPSPKGWAEYDAGTSFVANYESTLNGNDVIPDEYASSQNYNAALIPFIFNNEASYVVSIRNGFLDVFDDNGRLSFFEVAVSAAFSTTSSNIDYDYLAAGDPISVSSSVSGWIDDYSVGDFVFFKGSGSEGTTYVVLEKGASIKIKRVAGEEISTSTISQSTLCKSVSQVFNETDVTIWFNADMKKVNFAQAYDVMYIFCEGCKPIKLTRGNDSWSAAYYNPSMSGTYGFPATGCFYESRLFLAGFSLEPYRFFGSVTSDFENFTLGTNATDSFTNIAATRRLNTIQQLIPTERYLVAFCSDVNLKITGGDRISAITPTSISVDPIDYIGASPVTAAASDKSAVYLTPEGRRSRAVFYNGETETHTTIDLNRYNFHSLNRKARGISFQDGEIKKLWYILEAGELARISYEEGGEVIGWSTRRTRDGDRFLAMCCLSGNSNTEASAWAIVARGGKTFIEKFTINEEINDYLAQGETETIRELKEWRQVHLDSSLTYDRTQEGHDLLFNSANGGTDYSGVISDGTLLSSDPQAITLSSFPVDAEILLTGNRGKIKILGEYASGQLDYKIIESLQVTSISEGEWGVLATTISGLEHLAGQEVSAVVDGSYRDSFTVTSSGEITLSEPALIVHVGYHYGGEIQTHDIFFESNLNYKNVHRAYIKVLNSGGGTIECEGEEAQDIIEKEVQDDYMKAKRLYSGSVDFKLSDSGSSVKKIIIKQNTARPLKILNTTLEMTVGQK